MEANSDEYDDGGSMTAFETFQEEKKQFKQEAPYRRLIHFVGFFVRFLEKIEKDLNHVSETLIERYKSHLLTLKNRSGLYHEASWHLSNLKAVRLYLNWLLRKEVLKKPHPLMELDSELLKKEICERIENRRLSLLEKRSRNSTPLKDTHLSRLYLQNIEKISPSTQFKKHLKWSLELLLELLNKRRESILSFREIESLKEQLYLMERRSSIQISLRTFVVYASHLRHFYQWLFEQGYLKEAHPLSSFSQKEMISYYKNRKKHPEQKLKKRYYSTSEILIAFKSYLSKIYQGFSSVGRSLKAVEQFSRFLVFKDKSFYTADPSLIEEWKTHLLNQEHIPGRYYSAEFQSLRIFHVKRFFDWFTKHGYRLDHPLQHYKPKQYQKSIEKICSERKSGRVFSEDLPEPFRELYEGASVFEKTLNLIDSTICNHQVGWKFFFRYLEQIGIVDIKKVDELVLNDYQIYLHQYKRPDETSFSLNVIFRYLVALKRLFYYLARFRRIERDPSMAVQLPKRPCGLPTAGIKNREIAILLESVKGDNPLSIRDRTLLETLFSSGVRRNELRHLKVQDLDLVFGMIRITHPKGGRAYERVVPIGDTACLWLKKYLHHVRPQLIKGKALSEKVEGKEGHLFVSKDGMQMSGQSIYGIVKTHVLKSGLRNDKIVTHSFRVACATGMLKGKGKSLEGASIKWVQEQLGHSSIHSTEKYLRLVPSELKKIHQKHHPRERLSTSRKENIKSKKSNPTF